VIFDKADPDKKMPLRQIGGGFMDGKWVLDFPITPDKVLKALEKA